MYRKDGLPHGTQGWVDFHISPFFIDIPSLFGETLDTRIYLRVRLWCVLWVPCLSMLETARSQKTPLLYVFE